MTLPAQRLKELTQLARQQAEIERLQQLPHLHLYRNALAKEAQALEAQINHLIDNSKHQR